jgi:death-on-curing protein
MRRVELGEFLIISESHCGLSAEELVRIPRVVHLAEAALAAPFATGFGERELFPAPHEKAAIYCSRIATYHPLPDGNKRTAYDVMREFLDCNGVGFTHPPEGLSATARAIEGLAAGTLRERDFIDWVQARTQSA